MTVKTENTTETSTIIDDISDITVGVQEDKLAALKAKLNKKEEVPATIVKKKTRSLRFGVVGTGQGGSKLAACLYTLGYDTVVFNTAPQDLEHIQVPDANKMLLEFGLGGAAREKEIGAAAAESHRDAINELISEQLESAQVYILCSSLGGGSGAGSLPTMIDILSSHGKPVVVVTVLPMSNEDAQVKKNALETLSELTKEVQNKRVVNLIVVDNAKIESIYSDVSQFDFFDVSNKAIVAPIDAFNYYSSMPSAVKGLDSSEFGKILVDGGGLTVYGELTVANYEEETAIAEAVVDIFKSGGLLASGFDLKQSKYVGVLIVANKQVWSQIPSASVNYAMALVEEQCGPSGVFRGIYVDDLPDNVVKVYSIFSGLGLPQSRIDQLKKESQDLATKIKAKDQERNLNLALDTGTEETVSQADKVRQKIAMKKSAFGSLVSSAVQDRRKK